jgi:translation initiation factor 2B subunit (eIF-2B alpha/beta/delta family)
MTALATEMRDWQDRARQIAGDHESGATAIAADCGQLILSYLDGETSASLSTLHTNLEEIASIVMAGQPTMAPVIRVVNAALLAAYSNNSLDTVIAQVRNACQEWLGTLDTGKKQIAANGVSLLLRRGRVVTISTSSDVERTLLSAHERGYDLRVTILESRPRMEGRSLATVLAEHGISTRVVVDAAAHIVMGDADVWLTGADSLTPKGVVNKTGTALLGLSGVYHNVPGIVVCSTAKIWPAALGDPPILPQDAAEVWENPPPGVTIENPYFDLTPWSSVKAVATEQDIYSPDEITSYSDKLQAHPTVRGILEGIQSTG